MANDKRDLTIIVVLFVFLILLLIIGIIFYFLYRHKDQVEIGTPPSPSDFSINFGSVYHWGNDRPSGVTGKDTCQVYTFPGQGNDPGQPTLETDVLNRLTGDPNAPCYYPDQIAAMQRIHTCVQQILPGDTGGIVNMCRLVDGSLASLGATEVYYSTNCPQKACSGELGFISLPFINNLSSSLCLTDSNVRGSGVVGQSPCQLSSDNQQFVVTRYSFSPQGITLDNQGNLVDFSPRGSTLCLAIFNNSSSYVVGNTACIPNAPHWAVIPELVPESPLYTLPPSLLSLDNLVDLNLLAGFTSSDQLYNYLVLSDVNVLASYPSGLGQPTGVIASTYNDAIEALTTFNQQNPNQISNVVNYISTQFIDYGLFNNFYNPPTNLTPFF